MASYVDGIERPTKEQFEEHDSLIGMHTLLVSDPKFEFTDTYDVLEKVLYSANTVRNYCRRLLAGESSKRRRDDVDTPNVSDGEGTRKPPKMPRVLASKKRSRNVVDSSENEDISGSRKMPRMEANKKRSRDDFDISEDEGTPKPSKRARLGGGRVEMTKAIKELQDLLNSAKGL